MIKAVLHAGRLAFATETGKPRRSDLAFLPAALEILDTPPSPVRMSLIVLIGALTCMSLVWSYCSRLDIFAVATGKIRPTEQIKIIEPLETGRVRRIAVADGAHVKAGDVVLELDSTGPTAEVLGTTASLASFRAEALRRSAVVNAAEDHSEADLPQIDWPADIPGDIRDRETRVLRHDLGILEASMRNLKMQQIEKRAERDRLRATIDAETALIGTLQERVKMRNSLLSTGSGSKASMMDALQAVQGQQATLAGDRGWLAQAQAAITTLEDGEDKARESFIGENAQKLADAERQADDYTQRLIKAQAALDHMTLKSPISGTVQSLSITGLQQVVTSGQQVMRLVPDNAPLEVEAYLDNRDIGFVQVGQDVAVKVDSIPFTRYGTIEGRVVRVARDSIAAAEAQRAQSDPTQRGPIRSGNANSADATQALVYPVWISLSQSTVRADGQLITLTPGMSVNAEIRTGSRRLLEYIFAPLAEAASEALRER